MTRRIILALTEEQIAAVIDALHGAPVTPFIRATMASIRRQRQDATNAPADGACTVNLTYLADGPVGKRLTAHGVEISHAKAIYRGPTEDDQTELVALLVGPDQVAIPRSVLVALAGRAAVEDVEDQCDEGWRESQ